jgi:hypothetical protein
MRLLSDHIVEGDSANHHLTIVVQDEPGHGGANHRYAINGPDGSADVELALIAFQNGPIKEVGVNGITGEALLAIEIDRLRGFQDGPFRCRENAIALTHFEEGLMWLQKRTRDRIKRGVEGTTAA